MMLHIKLCFRILQSKHTPFTILLLSCVAHVGLFSEANTVMIFESEKGSTYEHLLS
jgi:hypothetical protein